MGEHNEFQFYLDNNISNIRSSDSCYTILAALHGIDFEQGNLTRIPTTNEYFNATLTEDQKQLAKKNINFLKNKYKNI
jgi:aminoglycoside phosphotransferase (APT) family kinase protein